ncbi:MAG: hypothetical protein ACLGI2_09220 [Acidimicrobiia bacterium]
MAAPEYVPTSYADKPRQSLPIPPPASWKATRPADLKRGQPYGKTLGRPGPDQGYALALAGRFSDKLELAEGEHAADAVAGCVALAMRRAGMLGRAPVVFDLELAFALFGFLGDAPADLVEWRHRAFRGASHDYWEQRAIVDQVPESTLRLSHTEVRRRLGEWRSLVGVGA